MCSQVLRGLPATTKRDRDELSIVRVDVQIPPDVSLKQRIFNCRQCRPHQHIAGSARARKAVHNGTGQLEGSILKLQSFRTLLGRVWTRRDASWNTAQHSMAIFFLFASFHRLSHVSETFPTRFANFPFSSQRTLTWRGHACTQNMSHLYSKTCRRRHLLPSAAASAS